MAQYQHLQIYKTSYELVQKLMVATKDYPRDYKYSLGEKLQNTAIEIVLNIYKANSAKDKTKFLEDILEKIQLLNLLLRISMDLKILPMNNYAILVELGASVAKQCQGWLNAVKGDLT